MTLILGGQDIPLASAAVIALILAAGLARLHLAALGRIDEARRQAEQRLGAALAVSPVVLSEQDLDFRYIWVSGSPQDPPADSLVGRAAADLFDADSCRRLDAVKREVIRRGQARRAVLTLSGPGGVPQVFDSYFVPKRDRRGAIVGVIVASTNITGLERRRARADGLAERLALAAESIGFGTIDWNPGTGSIDLSAEARTIFGLPEAGTVTPSDLARLIHPEDRAVPETDSGCGLMTVRFRILPPDGRVRWLEMRTRPFSRGSGGRPRRQIGVIRDVTRIVLTEQSMRSAEAQAAAAQNAKARFMAAASHDLRQPLQALNLYFAVLAARVLASETTVMDRIEDCLRRLNDLLGHMVDLNKLDAGVVQIWPRGLSLLPMMRRVAAAQAPLAQAKGVAVRVVATAARGWSDPPLLERILGNLVSNAVRYTPGGRVLIGCRRRRGRLWLEVHDTGIGIPADEIGEIFEEFKQIGNDDRNPENGRGLGLAIVRRIANLLGLEIRVRSRLGVGSVFAVAVPTEPDPVERANPLSYRPLNTTLAGVNQSDASP